MSTACLPSSPLVCKLEDVFEDSTSLYLVMELYVQNCPANFDLGAASKEASCLIRLKRLCITLNKVALRS